MNALFRKASRLAVWALVLLGGLTPRPLCAAEYWVPAGPDGSLAGDLAIHPRNPRILWAATLNAGIFKSVDGGATWAPSSRGLGASLGITALAVAPGDPDTLYAVVHSPVGVFRSTDGGRTWTAMLSCRPNPPIGLGCARLLPTYDLDVDPRNPRVLYAATGRGVFKSADGGRRWNRTGRSTSADPAYALAIDPENPRVLYAGKGFGVEKSEDGGATWELLRRGMDAVRITEIVIDPADPRRIWAGAAVDRGVYWTTDGGARWRRARSGLPWPGFSGVDAIALSPRPGHDLPILLASADRRVFRSLDGGLTWSLVDGLGRMLVADLAAHPSRPGTFWASTLFSYEPGRPPGIYKSGDGGVTWRGSSRGLSGLPMNALAFDPVHPGVLWAGSAEAGVFRRTDAGWSPRPGDLPGVQTVYDLAVDPHDPETVWMATFSGVWLTEDGGATWEHRSEGLLPPDTGNYPIYHVRPAPSAPSVAYAAGSDHVFKTVDAGEHWATLLLPGFGGIADLLVDPRDPETVFVAAGNLLISRDGGATWETVALGGTPPAIRVLALDPRNPDVLFAGGGNGLFRSADGGRTWRQVRHAAVTEVAVGPTSEVWVVTVNGIRRSNDGILGWAGVPEIAGVTILEIAIDPHDPEGVFLGTSAGLFRKGE